VYSSPIAGQFTNRNDNEAASSKQQRRKSTQSTIVTSTCILGILVKMSSKRPNKYSGLSKEDYNVEINKKSEDDIGSFQHADGAQLRERRRLKAKEVTPTTTNPFSNIQLVQPTKSSTRYSLSDVILESKKPAAADSDYETILAARNRLDQQFINSVLKRQQLNPHKPWTKANDCYLACHRKLDKVWYKLNPIVKTPSSRNNNNNAASTATTLFPAAAVTTTSINPFTAATAATTTIAAANPFGNFAAATQQPVVAPTKNLFGSTAAATTAPDNDDGAVEDTYDPNDQIQRDADPDWSDTGEYERVRFFKHGSDGKLAKFCSGTLRLQKHTSKSNISRMILRNLNGSEVLINIGITHNMPFTLSFEKNTGKIIFKGTNSVELGPEVFTITCKGSDAPQLHAQLVAASTSMTPK
jgi:hypothetical protein